jgi:hypothetical protein
MGNFEFLIPIVLFGVIGWIVHTAVTSSRHKAQLKATAEFQSKILEKMGSAKDFGEFLETDGGRRFMGSLTIEGPSAKTRIVRSAEQAMICLSIGIGFLLLGSWFGEHRNDLMVIGTIVTACGIGLLISCGSSFFLSKSFGLFDQPDGRKPL